MSTTKPLGRRLRSALAAVLVVIGCVLAPLSVVAVWASAEVVDTDRYVATMAPLAADPAIQDGVANRVTTAVVQQLDVGSLLGAAAGELPPRLASLVTGLAQPIDSGVTDFVHKQADRVVRSQAFTGIWTKANRAAHTAVVTFLTGKDTGAVQTDGDQITLDLGPLVDQVKQSLVDDGFKLADRIPEVHTQYVLFSSPDITKAQRGFALLKTLGIWLPVVVVVLLGLGVVLSARWRRTLVAAALGLCLGMVLLAVGLAVGRHVVLNRLPDTVSPAAAAAVFDTVVHFVRSALWTVFALAAMVAFSAWVLGPARPAAALREGWTGGLARLRTAAGGVGLRTGPVGPWVHRYRTYLFGAVVAVASLLLLFWSYPTPAVILWLGFGVLMGLAVVGFLGADSG